MRKESKEREMKRIKKQEWREKDKNLFIQINTQTDGRTNERTDGRTDRHKSFIDMRYYTEQYSKSNSIKENRIESNQIDLK